MQVNILDYDAGYYKAMYNGTGNFNLYLLSFLYIINQTHVIVILYYNS